MSLTSRMLPTWVLAMLLSSALVQLTVALARPVSTYRLLALGADPTAVGLVTAAFAVPPMLLAMSLGRWSDRRHPGAMLALGGLLSAASALLLAGSGSVGAVAAWTALLGIGHLATVVGAQSLVAHGAAESDGLGYFGLLTVAASLGQMAGPLAGGLLAEGSGPVPTTASTSLSLVAAAVVSGIACPVALVTLRLRSLSSAAREGGEQIPRASILSMGTTRGMPAALLASFGAKGSADLITAYLPLVGIALGLRATTIGFLLSISAAASILSRVVMPRLVRRVRRDLVIAVSTGGSALGIALLSVAGDVVVLGALLVMLGFLLALAQTVTMVWVVALVPATSRGAALGLRLTSNRVGQVAVPALAGLVAGALGVGAVFAVLGAALAGITLVVLRTTGARATGAEGSSGG